MKMEFISAHTVCLDNTLPNRFDMADTCFAGTHLASREAFEKILDAPQTAEIVTRVASIFEGFGVDTPSDEYHRMKNEASTYKKRLPVLLPHAHFTHGKRKNEDAELSPWVSMDIDGLSGVFMKNLVDLIIKRSEELRIPLAFFSPSLNGVKLLAQRPSNLTLEQAQMWLAHELGLDTYDHTHDAARCVFITRRHDLILYNPEMLWADEVAEIRLEGDLGELGVLPNPARTVAAVAQQQPTSAPDAPAKPVPGATDEATDVMSAIRSTHYDAAIEFNEGIRYSQIFDHYVKVFWGGEKPKEAAGWRHETLLNWAREVASLCDWNAVFIKRVTPLLGKDEEEINKIVRDALNFKQRTSKPGVAYRMKQALKAARTDAMLAKQGGTMDTPPAMPEKLPPLLAHVSKNVINRYKPAVCEAAFSALETYLHGVQFTFVNGQDYEATFSTIVIGEMSVGKGCIKKPVEIILQRIADRDEPNRTKEDEWKKKNPVNKSKKTPRPTDIVVQLLASNCTEAILNQRFIDADRNGGYFLHIQVDEIDALLNLTAKHKPEDVHLLLREAYDCAADGQERFGAESVSGKAHRRLVILASCTPSRHREFFKKACIDGTVTRLNEVYVPEGGDNESRPVFKKYDDKFTLKLNPYLDRLEAAKGIIKLKKALDLARELDEEAAITKSLTNSKAYGILSRRAVQNAFIKGMMLYVAHGKWNKEIEDYVRWSFKNDMWTKMRFLGEMVEENIEKDRESHSTVLKDMLQKLPDPFTREDYNNMRVLEGRKDDGGSQLRNWISRELVERDELNADVYFKTDKYKRRQQD